MLIYVFEIFQYIISHLYDFGDFKTKKIKITINIYDFQLKLKSPKIN